MWQDVNGNFCLLLCVESKLLYKRTEETGRERNRWSETDKARERFHSCFSSCTQ